MKATIPAQIAQTNCSIEVEIIDTDIPLLLSKPCLQKADTVLDLKNDKVKMFNKNVDFKLSSNGHYPINILPNDVSHFHETEQILILEQCTSEAEKIKISTKIHRQFEQYKSEAEKIKISTKIHRQFGHAFPDNMKPLLTKSKLLHQKISTLVDKIYKGCNTSIYMRPTPKPVVSVKLPLLIIPLPWIYILRCFHIIDEFSRYSNAVIRNTKSSSVIANHFLKNW